MTLADGLRYAAIVIFAGGVGFMTVTNVIAFQVLRPPKKLGFLWWHVTSISVSFLLLGLVALDRVFEKLGTGVAWQTVVTFVGITLFLVAQVIIFNVERSRLTAKKALAQAGEDHLIFDPATREATCGPHYPDADHPEGGAGRDD